MQEIAPGLRRWTAWHDHWEEQVGSVAVDTADGLVLIDPLDPPAELPSPKHVLLTLYYHARAAAGLKARVWAPARSQRPLRNRGVEAEGAVAGELPGGIVPFPTARAAEAVYWLPEHRAVVVGDVLLGAGAKPRATDEPLRLCPERMARKGDARGAARRRCDRCSTFPSSTCSCRTGSPWWRTEGASSRGR